MKRSNLRKRKPNPKSSSLREVLQIMSSIVALLYYVWKLWTGLA